MVLSNSFTVAGTLYLSAFDVLPGFYPPKISADPPEAERGLQAPSTCVFYFAYLGRSLSPPQFALQIALRKRNNKFTKFSLNLVNLKEASGANGTYLRLMLKNELLKPATDRRGFSLSLYRSRASLYLRAYRITSSALPGPVLL